MVSSQALLSEYVGSGVCYTGYASRKRHCKVSLTIGSKVVTIYTTYLNIKQVKKGRFSCPLHSFQKNTEYFNTQCRIFMYLTNIFKSDHIRDILRWATSQA